MKILKLSLHFRYLQKQALKIHFEFEYYTFFLIH